MITPFFSQNADLLLDTDQSALNADVVSGQGSVTIYSISKFAINQCLWIGGLGDEKAELIDTSTSVAPSGNTVTLASTLVKDHPKDTPVYIIPYDQVEFSHSATTTGDKEVRSLQTIDPEKSGNRWDETTYTTGYIFTRFKNSITGAYSNYSDPFPFAGQDMNTVGYLITAASRRIDPDGKIPFDEKLEIINDGLRYIRGKLKRWNTFQNFDYATDQTARGQYEYDLPSDIYDSNSNKSILAVRVGDGDNLNYMDKRELNSALKDSAHTTVATAPTVGQTTLVLTDSQNFPDSGSVDIFYNGTLYNVEYTGNSSDTLTGIASSGDGSITVAFPAGTYVWYGEEEGEPTHFTVYDSKLALHRMPDADYDNKDIFLDYYTDIVEVDSEGDTIGIHRYDMMFYWIRWSLRNIIERNAKPDYTDGDWMMFKERLADAIRKEQSGQKFKYFPKINRITDRVGNRLPFDRS